MADLDFLRVNLNPNMHFFHLKWHISDIASNRSEILFNILTFNGLISFLPQIFKKKEQWKLQNIRKKKFVPWKQSFPPRFSLFLSWSWVSDLKNNSVYSQGFSLLSDSTLETKFQIWPLLLLTFVGPSKIVFLKMKSLKPTLPETFPKTVWRTLLYGLS